MAWATDEADTNCMHDGDQHATSVVTIPVPGAVSASCGVPPVRRPQTVPGPQFSGDIGAEQPWGAWLDVPHGGLVAVEVRWAGGGGPTIRMATPAGDWWTPEQQPAPTVFRCWIPVPAGWTWISVEVGFVEQLAVQVATFLPVTPGS